MALKSHLALYRRNSAAIILFTLITAAASGFFAIQKNRTPYEATLFLTVGSASTATESSFENVQAADHFTETVQGWLKNPSLLQRIGDMNISARRQEKQNLIVNLSAETELKAKELSMKTRTELEKELMQYNSKTNSGFTLALTGETVQKNDLNPLLYPLLGACLGLLLGIGFSYLKESLST